VLLALGIWLIGIVAMNKEANVTQEEKKTSVLLYDGNSYPICFKAHHSFTFYPSFLLLSAIFKTNNMQTKSYV